MPMNEIMIKVYGAKTKCPSCVSMPSAKETLEWLEAALVRKYNDKPFVFHYIDIEEPPQGEEEMAADILENDRLYPLVTIQDEVIAEGNPRMKVIKEKIEAL